MSVDIQSLKNWLIVNKLTLNIIKTEFLLVGSRQSIATMTVNMEAFMNGISRVPLGPGAKKDGCFRRL